MKIILSSFLHALGVLIYVALVALIMQNGNQLFGQANGAIGIVAVLMLLVLSVTVVGLLIFGKAVMFYMDGHKKEAISLLLYIIGWLLLLMMIVFGVMFAWNS